VNDGALGNPSGTVDGTTTNVRTTTVTIDSVNDAPNVHAVGGDSSTMSLTESNSGFNTSRSLTITDPDSKTETLTLTNFSKTGPVDGLSDATLQGYFSVPPSVNITLASGSASFNWTFNSGAQAFDFLAVGETLTLNYNIHDLDSNNSTGTGQLTDDQPISVSIAGTNDAPVLNNAVVPQLADETEDAPAPTNGVTTGTLVSSLIDFATPAGGNDNVTDVDDNAVTGMAITGINGGAGSLWFSLNGGTTWTQATGLAANHALLLAADANTSVYIQPTANFNGFGDAFAFHAWDQTTGTAGNYGDTTTNGGTTAFSTAASTVSLNLTAVNDAPTVVNGTTQSLTAINEDASNPPGATVNSLFATHFSDAADNQTGNGAVGGSSADVFAGIAISANAATAAQGTWQYNDNAGGGWVDLPSVSDSSAFILDTTASLRFVPAANWNGTAPTLTSHLIDDSGGAVTTGTTAYLTSTGTGGSTQYSSGTVALSETITAVNDAPTVINGATESLAAIDEDTANPSGTTITTAFGGHFSDAADQVTGGSSANAFAGIAISANAATAAEGK